MEQKFKFKFINQETMPALILYVVGPTSKSPSSFYKSQKISAKHI